MEYKDIIKKTGIPDDRILMITTFGSHLYGTNTSKSDSDYKGVYIPTMREMLLGTVKKCISITPNKGENVKNTADDVDIDLYSLQYFIEMASKGDTTALDMIHAPDSMLIKSNSIWERIRMKRKWLYTKSLKAFVGYARKQASKYGIKGSRLNDAKNALVCFGTHMTDFSPSMPIERIWDKLPEGEHIFKHPVTAKSNGERMYEVCGRKLGERVTVGYAYDVILKFYENYGHRAMLASRNEGIDWKAMSHAIRVAYQMIELYAIGDIKFPLAEAEFIKEVKEGKHDYSTIVAPKLETLMDEVERLAIECDFPDAVDREFWDELTVWALESYQ